MLFHETSETPGTVGTLFSTKNRQKSTKNTIIRSILRHKIRQKASVLSKKTLKNSYFSIDFNQFQAVF